MSLIVIIDYYRRLNPSLVKVLEPNWDQNLFFGSKNFLSLPKRNFEL